MAARRKPGSQADAQNIAVQVSIFRYSYESEIHFYLVYIAILLGLWYMQQTGSALEPMAFVSGAFHVPSHHTMFSLI